MSKPTPTEIRESKQTRFDIESPSGKTRKFVISKTSNDTSEPNFRSRFFLSTLDPGFVYVGEFNPEDGELRLTGGSKYTADSNTFKIGEASLAVLFGRRELPEGFEIRKHEKGG